MRSERRRRTSEPAEPTTREGRILVVEREASLRARAEAVVWSGAARALDGLMRSAAAAMSEAERCGRSRLLAEPLAKEAAA